MIRMIVSGQTAPPRIKMILAATAKKMAFEKYTSHVLLPEAFAMAYRVALPVPIIEPIAKIRL